MSNFSGFNSMLSQMLRARIPFINVKSIERLRVMEAFKEISERLNIQIYAHNLSKGFVDVRSNKLVNDDTTIGGGLDFISNQIHSRQNLTFVFNDLGDIETENGISRQLFDLVVQSINSGCSICVITTNPVWSQLQRLGMSLNLDTPDINELKSIIKSCLDPYRSKMIIEWAEEEIDTASQILSGMTKIEVENIISTSMAKGKVLKEDLSELSLIKDKLFSNISGLERVKVDSHLNVAGLDGLQSWLNIQKKLITKDLSEYNIRPPRGVLLVGVPGCGKSLSCKFIASNWNLPLYRLDLASIQGQYLGQSENRLKEALDSADSMAPCVLWIDEIEKGLSGVNSNSDGGTSTRMVGQFLFWLQESQSRVFVVATANNVTRLPPELLRRGRFNELFFVDLPDEAERRAIIELYIKRGKLLPLDEDQLKELVLKTEGFSGADIESGIRDIVVNKIITEGEDQNTFDKFLETFESIVPLSRTSPEQIDFIRTWGKERAISASGKEIKSSSNITSRKMIL